MFLAACVSKPIHGWHTLPEVEGGKVEGGKEGGGGREGRVCVVAFNFCKDSSCLKNDLSCKLTLPETVIRTFPIRRCKVSKAR